MAISKIRATHHCLIRLGVAAGCCLLGSTRSSAQASRAPSSLGLEQSTCTETRSAERLSLGMNRSIYVEPMAIAATDGSVLLAGAPTYVWQLGEGSVEARGSDSTVGAFRTAQGQILPLLKPPVPGSVTDIRAVAVERGRFATVFAQLRNPEDRGSLIDYWYGSTDGRTWGSVERLSPPVSGTLLTNQASDLVRSGDSLWIAVPIRRQSTVDLAIYTRAQAKWSVAILPIGRLAYVALSLDETNGLSLAVVRPDTTMPRDWNSLSLFVMQDRQWTDRGFVVRGGNEPIYAPRLIMAGGVHILSWIARSGEAEKREARAARLSGGSLLGAVTTLARDVEDLAPVIGFTGAPMWVLSTAASDSGTSRLKIIQWTEGGPSVVNVRANPFAGRFLAFAAKDQVNVVGGIEGQGPGQEPVVSALLEMSRKCRP